MERKFRPEVLPSVPRLLPEASRGCQEEQEITCDALEHVEEAPRFCYRALCSFQDLRRREQKRGDGEHNCGEGLRSGGPRRKRNLTKDSLVVKHVVLKSVIITFKF